MKGKSIFNVMQCSVSEDASERKTNTFFQNVV